MALGLIVAVSLLSARLLTPQLDTADVIEQSLTLARQDRLADALALIDDALDREIATPLLLTRAQLHFRSGDYRAMDLDLGRAIEFDGADGQGFLMRAFARGLRTPPELTGACRDLELAAERGVDRPFEAENAFASCVDVAARPTPLKPIGSIFLREPTRPPPGPFSYRRLSRLDFRSSEPPPDYRDRELELAAATCASLELTGDTVLETREVTLESGEPGVEAVFADIGFKAIFDPECSWWNAEQMERSEEYVLEHEQIHFALFELAARDFNRRKAEFIQELGTQSGAPTVVRAEFGRELRKLIRRHLQPTLERGERFDTQTSRGADSANQQRWALQIALELFLEREDQ